MKRLSIIILFFLFSPIHVYAEQIFRFTPHISAEAWTRDRGSFSLQRAVGANLNTTFLLTSFNYAVLDRLEVGTVPVNYFIDEHKFNVNLKYNFWRTSTYLWSAGLSYTVFRLKDQAGVDQGGELQLYSLQLIFNYFPTWTRLKFGMNYNSSSADYLDDETQNAAINLDSQDEFGIDISYPIDDRHTVTLGLGWLREFGVSAFEDRAFGFGPSMRWYRSKKLLSSPTLGVHYVPETGKVAFLFSTTIY